jgi:integrase/recombinase XerC
MMRMKPPIVPERPVPIVPEDGLRRLLAVCAGRGFEARRDTAIMLLLDTGARRAELAGLQLAYVDLDLDVLLALGKSRRERALPFGHRAGEALERYLTALHTGVWSAQRLNPLWVRCPACRQVAGRHHP